LKRPLPLKSTTQTSTPVIRIQAGIDSKERIADFDSATDHALTLQKWQLLNMPLRNPRGEKRVEASFESVFHPSRDNTILFPNSAAGNKRVRSVWPNVAPDNHMPEHLKKKMDEAAKALDEEAVANGQVAPSQRQPQTTNRMSERKRWRYQGPFLASMTGMEFDAYLKTISEEKKILFRQNVKAHMVTEAEAKRRSEALDEGTIQSDNPVDRLLEPTEEEVTEYVRTLRFKPAVFGPLIAEALDLPDGPDDKQAEWHYGRFTAASRVYTEGGPPRTHPSGGLSYLQSPRFVHNDPVYGPQESAAPVVGRILKTRVSAGSKQAVASVGVAGFITPSPDGQSALGRDILREFEPRKGGDKRVVEPINAEIRRDGRVQLAVQFKGSQFIEDDKAVRREERTKTEEDNGGSLRAAGGRFSQPARPSYRRREETKPDENVLNLLEEMMGETRRRKAGDSV